MWRTCMAKAYRPDILFARYEHQMRATRPNRLKRPKSRQRLSRRNIAKGLTILARILLDRRGSRRLPPHVLEIHPAPPGARSDRAGLERRPLRASPHHVRARSLRGQGQCLALLGEGADARTRNHAAGVTGGMAARDCAQARSARGLFHAEAIANAEAGEEEENGAEDGLNGG